MFLCCSTSNNLAACAEADRRHMQAGKLVSATFPPEMELKFEKVVVVVLLYLRYIGMSYRSCDIYEEKLAEPCVMWRFCNHR